MDASLWSRLKSGTKGISDSFSTLLVVREHDGSSEDSTLVHKALVRYYTARNEPFPEWLGETAAVPVAADTRPAMTQTALAPHLHQGRPQAYQLQHLVLDIFAKSAARPAAQGGYRPVPFRTAGGDGGQNRFRDPGQPSAAPLAPAVPTVAAPHSRTAQYGRAASVSSGPAPAARPSPAAASAPAPAALLAYGLASLAPASSGPPRARANWARRN